MKIECRIDHESFTNSGKPRINFFCAHCNTEQHINTFLYSARLESNPRASLEEACKELLLYINSGKSKDLKTLQGKTLKIDKHLCHCIDGVIDINAARQKNERKPANNSDELKNKFLSCLEEELSPHEIEFDVIEFIRENKKKASIKIFIDGAGTFIEHDLTLFDFECFIRQTKKEILRNPKKCPFCNTHVEPVRGQCKGCGAFYQFSMSSSNDVYDPYPEFIKEISAKSGISEDVLVNFSYLTEGRKGDGNALKGVMKGVDVCYFGLSSFPVYFISKFAHKKKHEELSPDDKIAMFLATLTVEKEEYRIEEKQCSIDWSRYNYFIANVLLGFKIKHCSIHPQLMIEIDNNAVIKSLPRPFCDLSDDDEFLDNYYETLCEFFYLDEGCACYDIDYGDILNNACYYKGLMAKIQTVKAEHQQKLKEFCQLLISP